MEDPKKLEAWCEFQRASVLKLHEPALRQAGTSCVFQFCRTPTLEACVYWSIFRDFRKTPGELGRCFAVKGIWEKLADLEKWNELWNRQSPELKTLQPNVKHELARLTSEHMEGFLVQLCALKIAPFSTDSAIGADGTSYAFSLKHNFMSVDYCWWEDGPPEWRPMVQCVHEFAARLERQTRTELTVPSQ